MNTVYCTTESDRFICYAVHSDTDSFTVLQLYTNSTRSMVQCRLRKDLEPSDRRDHHVGVGEGISPFLLGQHYPPADHGLQYGDVARRCKVRGMAATAVTLRSRVGYRTQAGGVQAKAGCRLTGALAWRRTACAAASAGCHRRPHASRPYWGTWPPGMRAPHALACRCTGCSGPLEHGPDQL